MAADDPRKEALLDKLKKQLRSLEEDLSSFEARTAGTAKAEIRSLKKKKDDFERDIDDVEKAGDEAWRTMMEDLKIKAVRLRESFERVFTRHKP